jgi:16S rRNA (cytosine967-C5)-methyltransferase
MKLHKSLIMAVATALHRIFEEGVYADKAVEQILRQDKRWGSRDRKFIAETIYEMVRWWRLIIHAAGYGDAGNYDYNRLIVAWLINKGIDLPEWENISKTDQQEILERYQELKKIRKFRESIPDWLDKVGEEELGGEIWEKEIHALNEEAKVVLRANGLKTDSNKLHEKLNVNGIDTERNSLYPEALILKKRVNLSVLEEYKSGLFEIQDASSQLIAPFLEVEPGMLVIDACAGAGGKSLHIASAMRNIGKIISMDVEEKKLIELKKRADRGGATIIHSKLINEKALNELESSADRLLLDVPCSGLGVIRRNPDAKWKLSVEFLGKVKETQKKIINEYSRMLKPGGVMVYATCSILPGENRGQVNEFLKKNPDFHFLEDKNIMPHEGFDGFYMAKIKRN